MPEANAGSARLPAYEPDTIDASRVLVLAGIVLAVVIGSALGIA